MGGPTDASGSRARPARKRPRGPGNEALDRVARNSGLRALVADLERRGGDEFNPDRLFDMIADSIHRSAGILDDMVAYKATWLIEAEAKGRQIDREIEENWRGLRQLMTGGP
jgi:hypothetical protein